MESSSTNVLFLAFPILKLLVPCNWDLIWKWNYGPQSTCLSQRQEQGIGIRNKASKLKKENDLKLW